MMGRTGKGQHPQATGGKLLRLFEPPLALGAAERHHAITIHPMGAIFDDDFGCTLTDQQAVGPRGGIT